MCETEERYCFLSLDDAYKIAESIVKEILNDKHGHGKRWHVTHILGVDGKDYNGTDMYKSINAIGKTDVFVNGKPLTSGLIHQYTAY